MSVDIVVPRPVPAGERVMQGVRYQRPACDRCLREETDGNPILLSNPRPSYNFREALKGHTRRDALCVECRQYLRGQR